MEMNKLMVDAPLFLRYAVQAGRGFRVAALLWRQTGKIEPLPDVLDKRVYDALPAQWEYAALAPQLDGRERMLMIEALAQVDVRLGGAVLLAMARRLFLPELPVGHEARLPTEALLEVFEGWVLGNEPADRYVAEAFRYRSRFGTSFTAMGHDPQHEDLFDAMPAEGLCCALGESRWRLAQHWVSFGRYLAKQNQAWHGLTQARDAIDETVFVAFDPTADEQATEAAQRMIDELYDTEVDLALEARDDALLAVLTDIEPSFYGVWARQA